MREPIYSYRMTDYDRGLVPNRFVGFLDSVGTTPAEWLTRTGRSIGHPGWGLVYHVLLSTLSPTETNLIVETGTNVGTTTLVMAQALRDSGRQGRIRTIELDEAIHDEARRRAEMAGLDDLIEFHQGDSLTTLSSVIGPGEQVRVAFLDGNHFHDHVVREFELVEPHLAEGAVVLFDNTYLISEGTEDPRVNGALRTIVDRFGGNLVNLPVVSWYTPGIALWQRSPFGDMTPPAAGSFVPNS